MKYQMPALTDEQRDKMISDCNDFIANPDSYQDWFVVMAQIALAALTAPVLGYIHKRAWHEYKQAVCSGDDEQLVAYADALSHFAVYTAPPVPTLTAEVVYQQLIYGEWHDCDKGEYSATDADSRRVLYAAPPVPALKPIELPTTRLWAGKVDCFAKDEIISAIQAAGHEVIDTAPAQYESLSRKDPENG